jgi:hypothetical protein
MKPILFALGLIAFGMHSLEAETEKKAAATASTSAPALAKTSASKPVQPVAIELKNKSAFEMEANGRSPFWPIGWKPAPKLAESGADRGGGAEIPVTAFVISSITIEQGTKFAIVNGKVMQEGQQFGLQVGNQTYQVTLKAIEDGRVVISRRGQEVVVPLRRK